MHRAPLVLLTDKHEIKVTETHTILEHNEARWKNWHCEYFSHSMSLQSQTGIHKYASCGNNDTTCHHDICPCPTDIHIPKGIDTASIALLRKHIKDLSTFPTDQWNGIADGKIIAIGHIDMLKNKFFVVDWNILLRCNFDCTYCSPFVHDAVSPYPPMKTIKEHYNSINFPDGKTVHHILQGGEPVLHPNILEIAEMCRERGTVELLTNGTANIPKYEKFLDMGCSINISLHHEYITEKMMDKFIKLAELNKGRIVLKYFNVFDEKRFMPQLRKLMEFKHVGLVKNKRLVNRLTGDIRKKDFIS